MGWRLQLAGGAAWIVLCVLAGQTHVIADEKKAERTFGVIEKEARSDYSHIRIRRKNNVRTMLFVRESGEEVGESQADIRKPGHLLVPYTQFMFASYLFKPNPRRVLVVGVGGGSMVNFLTQQAPEVHVDAVEIDPVVVKLAAEYFDTVPSEKVNIITADGAKFLEETENKYDVIYMDAFLQPSEKTDDAGVPLELKTEQFYRMVQTKVAADGVVVFNLDIRKKTKDDIQTLRRTFSQLHLFRAAKTNFVAIGLVAEKPVSLSTQRSRARQIDRVWDTNFTLHRMLSRKVKLRR